MFVVFLITKGTCIQHIGFPFLMYSALAGACTEIIPQGGEVSQTEKGGEGNREHSHFSSNGTNSIIYLL